MNIKELSRESGLSESMIRSYIKKGVITPERYNGKYVFTPADLQKLSSIASMQTLGFSKDEIHSRVIKPEPELNAALKGVRRQHFIQLLRRLLIIAVFLFLVFLFWWNNFRTLTATFTVSSLTLSVSNIQEKDVHCFILAPDQPGILPKTFAVLSHDSVLFEEISAAPQSYSEAVIQLRIPIRLAVREGLDYDGFLLTNPDQIVPDILRNSNLTRQYVYLISVK